MKTGIIIGRFQVPYLHAGHLQLIATALRECDRVVIFLGTPPHNENSITDAKNPYSFTFRKKMISRIFPQVIFVALYDQKTDKEWTTLVDWLLEAYNLQNPTLYHSRDSFKKSYSGKYPLREVEEIAGYSGTKLREEYDRLQQNR